MEFAEEEEESEVNTLWREENDAFEGSAFEDPSVVTAVADLTTAEAFFEQDVSFSSPAAAGMNTASLATNFGSQSSAASASAVLTAASFLRAFSLDVFHRCQTVLFDRGRSTSQ